MTVSAKALIEGKYAANAATAEYTVPALTKAIIDKFTIVNTDTVTQTISVNIVPSAGTASDANIILKVYALNAGVTYDSQELKNQILNTGDFLSIVASAASKVSIRVSGREIT